MIQFFYYNLSNVMKKVFAVVLFLIVITNVAIAQTVSYNTKTKKIHKVNCSSAISCTVNCVKIEKAQAIKRGGVPCKRCGG